LRVEYSQSYDNSNGIFAVTASSLPTQYNNWMLIQNTGSIVPTPSGQYDVAVYTASSSFDPLLWSEVTDTWTAISNTWAELTSSEVVSLVDLIYSDRAYISGSNESSITTYVSPNENGTYTTYNG